MAIEIAGLIATSIFVLLQFVAIGFLIWNFIKDHQSRNQMNIRRTSKVIEDLLGILNEVPKGTIEMRGGIIQSLGDLLLQVQWENYEKEGQDSGARGRDEFLNQSERILSPLLQKLELIYEELEAGGLEKRHFVYQMRQFFVPHYEKLYKPLVDVISKTAYRRNPSNSTTWQGVIALMDELEASNKQETKSGLRIKELFRFWDSL